MTISNKKSLGTYPQQIDQVNLNKGEHKLKQSNAAYYLVPFLLKMYNCSECSKTRAIAKTIIDLDNLAQRVDNIIDETHSGKTEKVLCYKDHDNLEIDIIDCFSNLTGFPGLQELIEKTLESVNTSFYYNTVGRKTVYNLDSTEVTGSTMLYLFPLIEYLFYTKSISYCQERMLLLVTNYIQIIDDYVDLFEDLSLGIDTPITTRYTEVEQEHQTSNSLTHAFEIVTLEFQRCIDQYCLMIKKETSKINKQIDKNIFTKWDEFINEIMLLDIPAEHDITIQKEYLKKVHQKVPNVICYVGG